MAGEIVVRKYSIRRFADVEGNFAHSQVSISFNSSLKKAHSSFIESEA